MVAPNNRIQDHIPNLDEFQTAACQAIEDQPIAFALAAFGVGIGLGVGIGMLINEGSSHQAQYRSVTQQVTDTVSRMLPNAIARHMASFGR